ncbi:hypothetical protein ABH925_007360 [Streptacidiphilus sp. EB129]
MIDWAALPEDTTPVTRRGGGPGGLGVKRWPSPASTLGCAPGAATGSLPCRTPPTRWWALPSGGCGRTRSQATTTATPPGMLSPSPAAHRCSTRGGVDQAADGAAPGLAGPAAAHPGARPDRHAAEALPSAPADQRRSPRPHRRRIAARSGRPDGCRRGRARAQRAGDQFHHDHDHDHDRQRHGRRPTADSLLPPCGGTSLPWISLPDSGRELDRAVRRHACRCCGMATLVMPGHACCANVLASMARRLATHRHRQHSGG